MRIGMQKAPTNPFRFGALALDDAFADREAEIAELADDVRNGQYVVVFAPRRYGKSSLLWAAARSLGADSVLVAQVDLMTAPTKERLGAAVATSIFAPFCSPVGGIREKALAPFRGLSVKPTITIDAEDGSLSFSFGAGSRRPDID